MQFLPPLKLPKRNTKVIKLCTMEDFTLSVCRLKIMFMSFLSPFKPFIVRNIYSTGKAMLIQTHTYRTYITTHYHIEICKFIVERTKQHRPVWFFFLFRYFLNSFIFFLTSTHLFRSHCVRLNHCMYMFICIYKIWVCELTDHHIS